MNTEYDEVTDVVRVSELTTTERIAIVAAALMCGGTITAHEAAELAGCTKRHAWRILEKISRVLPITNDNGLWFSIHD